MGEYVTYDIAKILKNKGYSYIEKYAYLDKDFLHSKTGELISTYDFLDFLCPIEIITFAPTLWKVVKWLREEYNIAVCVHPYDFKWDYVIFDLKNTYDNDDNHKIIASQGLYSTYEESLNNGIKEALKLI